MSKHDKYLLELERHLANDHDILGKNIVLTKDKRSIAEIDLLAMDGNMTEIYEVKCSYRPHKASRQLKKIKKILGLDNCRMFFYCGSSGLLQNIV